MIFVQWVTTWFYTRSALVASCIESQLQVLCKGQCPRLGGEGDDWSYLKNIEYNKLHLQIPSEEKTKALTLSFKKPPSIDNTHQLDKAFNCHKIKVGFIFLKLSEFRLSSFMSFTLRSPSCQSNLKPPYVIFVSYVWVLRMLQNYLWACCKSTITIHLHFCIYSWTPLFRNLTGNENIVQNSECSK